ncbi:hypothetical protein F4677DRAFT_299932 [Hypoxylon crocopeplum]|nr:hypothetical protein F4677DRAFT_299932 [Hypoxylon crocopeplum]
MATISSNKSLCYREAATAKQERRINDDEYYHHVLRHLTGESHDNEYCTKDDDRLRKYDPFGYSVQGVSREMDHIKDAVPFEQVFKAYSTGNLEDTIVQHDSLDENHAKYLRKLLAMRALLDRRDDVLRFSLERGGFEYDDCFKEESLTVCWQKETRTFNVLEETVYRKYYPHRQHPAVIFDVGGRAPVDW